MGKNEKENGLVAESDSDYVIELPRILKNDRLRFFLAWLSQRFFIMPILWLITRVFNRTEVIGQENLRDLNHDSFIVCPNHTSSYDIWVGLELAFLINDSVFSRRHHLCGPGAVERLGPTPIRFICWLLGILPLDRKKGLEQFAMQDLLRLFQSPIRKIGCLIYPEGTRSKDGRISENFKAGVGWIQAKSGAPVIPVYQQGYANLPGLGRKLRIVIGKPLFFTELADKRDQPTTWITISRSIMDSLRELENAWSREDEPEACYEPEKWTPAILDLRKPLLFSFGKEGQVGLIRQNINKIELPNLSDRFFPAQKTEEFGSLSFRNRYNLKFSYGVLCFEDGFCTEQMVLSLAEKGFLGFLDIERVSVSDLAHKLEVINGELAGKSFGVSLRLFPGREQEEEEKLAICMEKGVSILAVAGCYTPTDALWRFRFAGAGAGEGGERKLLVRISHEHAAVQFLQPVSSEALQNLIQKGHLTEADRDYAVNKSTATDLMVEIESLSSPGKSFGHLFFTLSSLKVRFLQAGTEPAGLGLCGGIATPEGLASALAMGADFVMTTDINRLSEEAEQPAQVREYLLAARPDDFTMVSMPEYFGTAARVPVFKYGSVFAIRATRMDQIYRRVSESGHLSLEDYEFLLKQWPDQRFKDELLLLTNEGKNLHSDHINKQKLKELLWVFFLRFLQDSLQLTKDAVVGREKDYQIRCSADIGVFNEWRKGGNLGQAANITVGQIAHALLSGAALSRRILQMKEKGIPLPARVLRLSVQQQEKNTV